MSDSIDQPLSRFLSERLADLLSSSSGTLLLSYFERLHSSLRPASPSGISKRVGLFGGSQRVGIWEVDSGESRIDPSFHRVNGAQAERRRWADVDVIEPKTGRTRIAIIGESAARGYFYDPILTPAQVLERFLNASAGLNKFQVTDLACNDLRIANLVQLLTELPVLRPDALVFYAGNNWQNVDLPLGEMAVLGNALRTGGLHDLKRTMTKRLVLLNSNMLLRLLAALSQHLAIPVVVVVPEFNLGDWRDEVDPLVPPLLDNQAAQMWLSCRERAEKLVSKGHFSEALRAAHEMLSLDMGCSPVAYRMIGEATLRLGEIGQARMAFEQARDAACCTFVPHSPRCTNSVQALLRKTGTWENFSVVDLPQLIAAQDPTSVPGRRWFLDYCHPTVEGIHIAMKQVTNELLDLFNIHRPPPESLEIPILPRCTGTAHFLAAIHNAHYGQRDEIVMHHCQAAIRTWPPIANLMTAFVDSRLRPAPQWCSDSYRLLWESAQVRRYLHVEDPRKLGKLADFDLALHMLGAVPNYKAPEVAILEIVGKNNSTQNLLSPERSATTFRQREGYSLAPRAAFFRSARQTSVFFVCASSNGKGRFEITLRVPHSATLPVDLLLNSEPIRTLPTGAAWRSHVFTVAVPKGLSRLEIEWPRAWSDGREAREEAADRLERGSLPDPLPVVGEIHRFVLTFSTYC